jgi:hypothetical protein
MDPPARRFAARHRLGQAVVLTERLFHEAFSPESEYRLFVDEFVDYSPGEDQRFLNFEIQVPAPGGDFHKRFVTLLEGWSSLVAGRAQERLIVTFRSR